MYFSQIQSNVKKLFYMQANIYSGVIERVIKCLTRFPNDPILWLLAVTLEYVFISRKIVISKSQLINVLCNFSNLEEKLQICRIENIRWKPYQFFRSLRNMCSFEYFASSFLQSRSNGQCYWVWFYFRNLPRTSIILYDLAIKNIRNILFLSEKLLIKLRKQVNTYLGKNQRARAINLWLSDLSAAN